MNHSYAQRARLLFGSSKSPTIGKAMGTVGAGENAQRPPEPSSAVDCAIPITLRMLTGNPRVLVRRLDVSGAMVHADRALPTGALAWLRLPFPDGAELVRARVVRGHQRSPGAPWVFELRFELTHPETRAGLCGLLEALRIRQQRRSNR